MELQDKIFEESEGNQWFHRNHEAINSGEQKDFVTELLSRMDIHPKNILEIGCSNGWRLEKLRKIYGADAWGIDVSAEAIKDGTKRFPKVHLSTGALADFKISQQFDLVVCNFLLHWIDRRNLFLAVSNIDKTVGGGGLIIGDFFPDYNQKRRYHHLPMKEVYTYKQDYANLFISSGIYRECSRIIFSHDSHVTDGYFDSGERAMCVALRKMKYDEYYPEV